MQVILNRLLTLDATKSTLSKTELLKKYLEDDLFVKVVTYALDSRLSFNVKKFPKQLVRPSGNLQDMWDFLDRLAAKSGATAPEKNKLFSLASQCPATFELVKRICNKDLKCGVGVSLINTAKPKTIFEIPYCRCSTDKKIDRIVYPAYVQEKCDGMFDNTIAKARNDIEFLTRDGKVIYQLGVLRSAIATYAPEEYFGNVLQGELRIRDPKTGKLLSRQEGNGIFTSAQFGQADQELMDNAVLCLWNMVSIDDFWEKQESTVKYREVMPKIAELCRVLSINGVHCVELVKTKRVESYEEGWEFYLAIREDGGEGAILKNYKLQWKYHTSTDQIKLKNVQDCDLIILKWLPATEGSKYDGMMGALLCGTKCGLLEVKIGTGFSDEDRKLGPDYYEGNVCEGLYESVSKSKTDKLHSLYLPRFNGLKKDRNRETADTLEDILKR